MNERFVTTGLPGLDDILSGLRLGDNVVWRVDDVADYRAFVLPYAQAALAAGRQLVYVKFGQHPRLLEPAEGIREYDLDAHRGFESFTVRLHNIIAAEGVEAFYVFDCLSDLLDAWATDAMIGHFFRVTCPYLFELDTVAYFGLLRSSHAQATVSRIRETTQLLLDVHRAKGRLYLHPLKVDGRWSHTMFLPHQWMGPETGFRALTSSMEATTLFSHLRTAEQQASGRMDYWEQLFLRARELTSLPPGAAERATMVGQLARVLLGTEERMLGLARTYFQLEDLVALKPRMVGTGFIGGKTVGMLLARKILAADAHRDWAAVTAPHDSWYIGADVYYSFLVDNGWWRLFMEHKTAEGYFGAGEELHERMLSGHFPPEIREEFQQMLEYFGQYPIIVRSSSLQEDGFGNAFAGKYDSVFLVGQGSPGQRYEQFLDGIRRVYASTMSPEALSYRRARGLDRAQEQMALLVQRVSGAYHEEYFFPQLAGVGVSYNTFVWDDRLDPHAGMLRLVFGLGTRAVDRVGGDYPRIVSLDQPLLVPHADLADAGRFSQRYVDLLDIAANGERTVALNTLTGRLRDVPWKLLVSEDQQAAQLAADLGRTAPVRYLLSFDGLLRRTEFAPLMRELLAALAAAYEYPVDVEFTAHLTPAGELRINLVQCRPMQTRGIQGKRVVIPTDVPAERVLFSSVGHFMGGSMVAPLRRVIIVHPQRYTVLPQTQRHFVGRVVGRLNQLSEDREALPTALLGPGRWGTSTPSLGVPVSFAQIRNVAVLGEIAFTAEGLMPELSFGSHFFQDLVEAGIFYVALFPERGAQINWELWEQAENRLPELLPGDAELADIIKVVDFAPGELRLEADILSQRVLCYQV
ncbi:MAG: PEP/pyruvate-binding domain-containing protein [Candidatus Nanopelagicales bacterium]